MFKSSLSPVGFRNFRIADAMARMPHVRNPGNLSQNNVLVHPESEAFHVIVLALSLTLPCQGSGPKARRRVPPQPFLNKSQPCQPENRGPGPGGGQVVHIQEAAHVGLYSPGRLASKLLSASGPWSSCLMVRHYSRNPK